MLKPIIPFFIKFIRGKISKKSNIVFRVRNGRQQCYILNYIPKPPTDKQSYERMIFKKTNKLVWRDMKNLERKTQWETIAALSIIPKHTARKAAFAHYYGVLKQQFSIAELSLKMNKTPKLKINHELSNIEKSIIISNIEILFYILTHQFKCSMCRQH